MTHILVTPRSFGKTDQSVWQQLEKAGLTVIRNPTQGILDEQQLLDLLPNCEGIIVGVDPLTAEVLQSAPHLRAIAKYGVGVDNIDLDFCQQHGIKVSRTVGANADAVADFAFTLMLAVARKVVQIDQHCRQGDWRKITSVDVSGRTLGLLGLGAIGRGVALRAQGFNMRVMAYDVFWDAKFAAAHHIEKADPEQIYRGADFISLHLPLLPETKNLIGEPQIALMKPTAILINTARGGLIDEAALLQALQEKRIYGAGMDVFCEEPPTDPGWFCLDNLVLGSHASASTIGATEKMAQMAALNLIRDLNCSELN